MRRLTWLSLVILTVGCSTIPPQQGTDHAEILLAAPESQVRAAVIQVLVEGGYPIQQRDGKGPVVRTDYREEMDSPGDSLHRSRFGKGRSRVEVTIVSESDTSTRLTIQVAYEGKNSLFASWQPYVPTLPQSAANQIRLIKNALGLL
ncbi:MAG: hypothetical protein HZA21_05210 [Nitrospirae bacterium]|nr:hypothetical protein [Nitrospirota bacterium]